MRKKIGIIVLLFTFFALISRLGSYWDTKILEGRQPLTFQVLGSGGDPDYQLYCAIESMSVKSGSIEMMMHYDYFFLCPGMAAILDHFSYVTSFEIFAYITIAFGLFCVLLPLFLFNLNNPFNTAGIVGSLVLLTSDVMINNSDGRFYIYPLVAFTFSIFLLCYIHAIRARSLNSLFALGSIAIIQGISKPFLYVSDIPLFIIFPFIYALSAVNTIKKFPYITWSFSWQDFKKGCIPGLIYFSGIIGFEILHHYVTNRNFFLSDLFLPQDVSTKDAVLSASLQYDGPTLQKIKNITGLFLYGFYKLLSYIPYIQTFLFIGVTSLLITGKNRQTWFFTTLLAIGSGMLFLTTYVHKFLYPNVDVPTPLYTTNDIFLVILFVWFLILLIFRTKHGLALIASHIFYLFALSLTLAAVSQHQLFVTLIIWITILISYSINDGISTILSSMATRVQYLSAFIFVLLFLSFFINSVQYFYTNYINRNMEIEYLRWAQSFIPEDGYILGGIDDSLPLISKTTNREVIYNARYSARMVRPKVTADKVYQHPVLADYIALQATASAQPRFYILDNNSSIWERYLEYGTSGNYPARKYKLTELKYNEQLQRRLFYLDLRDKDSK